ncbi:MAG: transposase [Fuerstiella sp.]
MRIYGSGLLPHWRQHGCTYFVTFRLADSVPRKVVEQWKYERDKWLQFRGIVLSGENWRSVVRQLGRTDYRAFERHFAGRLFAYLDDCRGECLLRKPDLGKLVVDALRFFDGRRLDCGDFVVMPNHVHWIVTPRAEFELEDILHSVKSFTANEINRKIGRTGQLWMEESYDRIIRNGEELLQTQRYIRENPRKAGLKLPPSASYAAEYMLKE